jgi:hypothetical protein
MDPNTDAKTLNLDGNNIGVHGAQVLAKELKDRSTLQVLWKLLSDKNFGVESTMDIAKSERRVLRPLVRH